jgi:Bacterial Ig domain
VRRPSKVDQQGSKALTPPDVENGGGLGGGPGHHRDTALSWARSQRGLRRWAWRCERFVEEAYGTRGKFRTAAVAASRLKLHRESITSAPPGSLVYFAADRYNRGFGHVGLALSGGRMISALSRVTITNVAHSSYWRRLYLGWADAPDAWPGRLPPPPGPTTTDPTTDLGTVRVTAPAAGQVVSGPVELMATASSAGGVAFDAYYATDPRYAATLGWHTLGVARREGDGWALDWDTSTVPDQGYAPWGTVNVAAIALDANGQRTAMRDYRRLSIDNTTGSRPPTPPDATTFPETTGGVANTWSDYASAGGAQGTSIGSNVTVQVACAVRGYQVPDGNSWWYRIASSPWSGAYYASADAFYNNGQTSGSLAGTPFVDPAVPACQ